MHILRSCLIALAAAIALPAAWAAAAKPPTVSITSPAPGATFGAPGPITIAANAAVSTGTIARVDFYRGGSTLIGTATTSPYRVTWANVPVGSHSLTAKATSSGGLSTTSAAVNVTVTTQPPTVALTSPANGAAFSAPADIPLAAAASDADGTVQRVDFYSGASLIGSSTAAPFSATWAGVAAGSYSITARATDNAGAQTSSAPVTVNVGAVNIPPLVAISSPDTCGPFTAGASFSVTADAVDPDGTVSRVEFYEGTSLIGAVGNPNVRADLRDAYRVGWSPAPGSYTLTAVAYDNKNAATTSAPLQLTIAAPPSIRITAPADGATVSVGAAVPVSATVTAGSGATVTRVDFAVGYGNIASVTSLPYATTWRPVYAGTYSINANVTDSTGTTVSATPVLVTVLAAPPPSVSLTSPQLGSTFTVNSPVTLAANASSSSGTVAKVEFFAGASLVGTATAAPYTANWTPTLAGSYALTAKATDSAGVSETSASVGVTIAAFAPPSVSVTSPAPAVTVSSAGRVNLAAAVTPSPSGAAIAQVSYASDGVPIGTSAVAPYAVTWANPPVGSHAITATVTDVQGASATSAPVGITVVDSAPPTVSVTGPAGGSGFAAPANIALSASAAAAPGATIAKVDFYQGQTLVATATTAPYLATWTGAAAGTYAVTAVATDSYGVQATSVPVSVTVGALAAAFTSPANGASLNGTSALVQGTFQAPANSGVTVNGVVAMTQGTKFYARVPLAAGSNDLTATITAPTGQTVTQSITVIADGVPRFLDIETTETEGVAPLAVTYTVTNRGDTSATVSFNGQESGTLEPGQSVPLVVNYSGSGTVFTTVSGRNASGEVSSETFAVVLMDRAVLEQKLKALWSGMGNALAAGDKATALNYLSAPARTKYGPVFDVLLPDLPQILASFSEPQASSLGAGIGEFAVNRTIDGVNNIFFVYYLRGADGVWRLESM